MAASINQVATLSNEIVLTERIVTTEWKVTEIHESIENRSVRVNVELGPFVDGRGSSRRGFTVWENEEYDTIRDTWTNADLLTKVKQFLEG